MTCKNCKMRRITCGVHGYCEFCDDQQALYTGIKSCFAKPVTDATGKVIVKRRHRKKFDIDRWLNENR